MDLRSAMLSEFVHEAGLTRSLLDVVPDSLLDYQADESLQTVRWNVSHLVDIPTWMDMILTKSSFDVAPVGEPPHSTPAQPTMAEAIETFDRHVADAKAVIERFDLDSLDDEWSLLLGGQPILTHPRYMIYRMYIINHVAHHRGHLLVYLRTNGVETPRLYG